MALELAPDLATVVAGMNDVLRPSFDADRIAEDVGAMQRALVGQGATVLTFTLPDPAPVMPLARRCAAGSWRSTRRCARSPRRPAPPCWTWGRTPSPPTPPVERRPAARQQRRARADRCRARAHRLPPRVRRLGRTRAAGRPPARTRGSSRRAGVDPAAPAALAGPPRPGPVVGRRPGRKAPVPLRGAASRAPAAAAHRRRRRRMDRGAALAPDTEEGQLTRLVGLWTVLDRADATGSPVRSGRR